MQPPYRWSIFLTHTHFKSLPRPGAVEYCDPEAVACWSYDSENRLMVTYDTPYSAVAKADYIKQRNLGGAMWWDSSGDRTDERSIISSVREIPATAKSAT